MMTSRPVRVWVVVASVVFIATAYAMAQSKPVNSYDASTDSTPYRTYAAAPIESARQQSALEAAQKRVNLLLESLRGEITRAQAQSKVIERSRAAAADAPADRKGEEGFRALYTMSRNGADVEFLAAAPGMISSSSPEYSHDGRMVAFDAVPEVGALSKAKLFVYALEGPFKGKFADLGWGNVPSWSPDDQKIAFMVNGGNPGDVKGGIWVMDADGSNRTWLSPGFYARWSPDGREICIDAFFDNPASLKIINLETKAIRTVHCGRAAVKYGGATWSPDGKQLAVIVTDDGHEALVTVAASGEPGTRRILYGGNSERELVGPPSWSPDGKQIAFAVHDKNDQGSGNHRWHHTYIWSVSVKSPHSATFLEGKKVGLINRSMMWSPDSQKIIFSSER